MDNIDKIRFKILKVREFVDKIKPYQRMTVEKLEQDHLKSAAIERYLQLTVDMCVDIAEIVGTDQRLKSPEDGTDAILILGKENIIEEEFAKEFSRAVGFRNILVHQYVDIDYGQVADVLNNRLDEFEEYCQQIAKHYEIK